MLSAVRECADSRKPLPAAEGAGSLTENSGGKTGRKGY